MTVWHDLRERSLAANATTERIANAQGLPLTWVARGAASSSPTHFSPSETWVSDGQFSWFQAAEIVSSRPVALINNCR